MSIGAGSRGCCSSKFIAFIFLVDENCVRACAVFLRWDWCGSWRNWGILIIFAHILVVHHILVSLGEDVQKFIYLGILFFYLGILFFYLGILFFYSRVKNFYLRPQYIRAVAVVVAVVLVDC